MTAPDDDVVHVLGQLGLFAEPAPQLPGTPATAPDTGPLSADRRRTARQRQLVADGWHPLTRDRARPDLGTCGDCVHRQAGGRAGRSFPKCDLGPVSKGPGTDVRAHWPACSRWEPREAP
jgi:hypothetical protein